MKKISPSLNCCRHCCGIWLTSLLLWDCERSGGESFFAAVFCSFASSVSPVFEFHLSSSREGFRKGKRRKTNPSRDMMKRGGGEGTFSLANYPIPSSSHFQSLQREKNIRPYDIAKKERKRPTINLPYCSTTTIQVTEFAKNKVYYIGESPPSL